MLSFDLIQFLYIIQIKNFEFPAFFKFMTAQNFKICYPKTEEIVKFWARFSRKSVT